MAWMVWESGICQFLTDLGFVKWVFGLIWLIEVCKVLNW